MRSTDKILKIQSFQGFFFRWKQVRSVENLVKHIYIQVSARNSSFLWVFRRFSIDFAFFLRFQGNFKVKRSKFPGFSFKMLLFSEFFGENSKFSLFSGTFRVKRSKFPHFGLKIFRFAKILSENSSFIFYFSDISRQKH